MKHLLFISQFAKPFRSYAFPYGSLSGNLATVEPFSTI